jgi:proline dehydrogenase
VASGYLPRSRQFFLRLSQNQGLRRWMETSPAAKILTRRFIAGGTLADELTVCETLAREGTYAALDHLGENVTTLQEADASVDAYLDALNEIDRRKLPATVSMKLTHFGLDLSEEKCVENVLRLSARAKEIGTRVEIDMESTVYTERTLRIAERIHAEHGCVRTVIQAYLFRSAADIDRMNELGIPVRLCKGAYNEPPEVAYPKKPDVDSNYVALMHKLLDHGTYPALATHDDSVIAEALRHIRERGITPDQFEFQMLYGVRRDLQEKLRSQGYRLRLYIPYGAAWYPYFMRRLAERPANVWFVLKSLLR